MAFTNPTGPVSRVLVGFILCGAALSGALAGDLTVTVTLAATGDAVYDLGDYGYGTDHLTINASGVSRYVVVDTEWGFESDGDPEFTVSHTPGGGGSMVTQDGSWTWGYVDPPGSQPLATASLRVGLDPEGINYGSVCHVSVNSGPRPLRTGTLSGDSPLPGDLQETIDQATQFSFDVPVKRENWTFTKTQTHTQTFALGSVQCTAEITVRVELNILEPPPWEAVICPVSEPGLPRYEKWRPTIPEDETIAGTNSLPLQVEIRPTGGNTNPPPKAWFTITLEQVSREPGVCLNSPARAKASTTPDLRIVESDDIRPTADGQSATTEVADTSVRFLINGCDSGGYGQLRVVARTQDGQVRVAHLEGQPGQTLLSLPKDDNTNHVADAWEVDEGVFPDNLRPAADCATEPKDQARAQDGQPLGDGISLYERYRGFETVQGWVSLKARQKYVFVRDADGLLLSSMLDTRSRGRSFPDVTKCRVLFIGAGQWTGAGPFTVDRIVNFNTSGFGHATDQHALHLEANDDSSPLTPAAWRREFNLDPPPGKEASALVDSSVLGQSYPCLDAMEGTPNSPVATYKCVVFRGNFIHHAVDMVRYHTRDLQEFRPYANPALWWAMSAEEQNVAWKQIDDAARAFVAEHPADYEDWRGRMVVLVTTHELCHGVGTWDHEPLSGADPDCVMRYFRTGSFRDGDFPRNSEDRFELAARTAWPASLCRAGNGQPSGGCWKAVRVSDPP